MNKVGCDLEYVVKNVAGGYIPAGFLPITGIKGHPEPYPTGGVEIDCCAVELTVPPAESADAFVSNILCHLEAMREKYRAYGELVTVSSVEFDPLLVQDAPQGMKMGCDPDINVWTGRENPKPKPKSLGFRTFGGHVHIDGGDDNLVKACDLTLGLWSVCADKDKERRSLYGKAGAFRHKPYGIEYRVLSNFWCGDEEHIRQVWTHIEEAKRLVPEVDQIVKAIGGPKFLQKVINDSIFSEAYKIRKTLGFRT